MRLSTRGLWRKRDDWDDDDEWCDCGGFWRHPVVVAAVTVALTAIGELYVDAVKRSRGGDDDDGDGGEIEAEVPSRRKRKCK